MLDVVCDTLTHEPTILRTLLHDVCVYLYSQANGKNDNIFEPSEVLLFRGKIKYLDLVRSHAKSFVFCFVVPVP